MSQREEQLVEEEAAELDALLSRFEEVSGFTLTEQERMVVKNGVILGGGFARWHYHALGLAGRTKADLAEKFVVNHIGST
jgi:hypothetical protein